MMMLSMLRSLKNTMLLSSLITTAIYADQNSDLQEYLINQIENNPIVKQGDVKIVGKKPLKSVPGWEAYILDVDVTLKQNNKKIHQKNIIFYNGRYVASDFIDIRSGKSLKDKIKPDFKKSMYDDKNIAVGDKNAVHRIVVFSDPLCPFCRKFVPEVIEDIKKYPKKYVLYHYNLPLTRLHPASEYIVKAEIAAELKGKKIDIYKLYTQIQPEDPKKPNYIAYSESDPKKVLAVFNKVFGTNITLQDLSSPEVLKRYNKEKQLSDELLVAGTPTFYFDEKFDRSRKAYKKVK